VYGTRGMVSCSQPLAAEAGLRILQSGGNAADAAVAVAAALGVTEPCSTGACLCACRWEGAIHMCVGGAWQLEADAAVAVAAALGVNKLFYRCVYVCLCMGGREGGAAIAV
jgi:hypothetical protein